MTRDLRRDAALGLHRFGLGPRPGSIAAFASDPRGALLAELDRPGAGRIDDPELRPGVSCTNRRASSGPVEPPVAALTQSHSGTSTGGTTS